MGSCEIPVRHTCEACHREPKQLASSVAIIPFSHVLLPTKATLAKFELMENKNPSSILFSPEYIYQKFTLGNAFEIQEERTFLQKEAKTFAQTWSLTSRSRLGRVGGKVKREDEPGLLGWTV